MRRAVLHIGMDKAGSTTLQVALRAYDAPGITWLRPPPYTQTQAVCLPFKTEPPSYLYTVPEAEWPRQRADARAAFDAALAATDKSVLISSEFMCDFRRHEDIAALRDALLAHVDRVEALAYLRAPAPYLCSVFQEMLKRRPPPRAVGRLWPGYRARFAPWDAVLGRDTVTIRPFARAAFPNGDLLADFAAQTGLDPATLPRHVRRANESLSAEALALLYAYRMSDARPAPHPRLTTAENRTVFLLKGFGTARLRFGADLVRPVLRRQAEDIAWAEARQGAPFADEPASGETVEIGAFDDLADHAAAQVPAFEVWLSETQPDLAKARPACATPADRIGQIVGHYLQQG